MGQVTLTSNRDEHIRRPLAHPPQKVVHNGTTLYYPIDPLTGGTWFCVKETGAVLILLNGASEKHISQPPYLKSRGLILLELAEATNLNQVWSAISLQQIEPFTIVAYLHHTLLQLRWDGREKSLLELDTSVPHLWSSATLYTKEARQMRQLWFADFVQHHHGKPTAEDLFAFHTETKPTDTYNGLIINRNDTMRTQSVTQCIIQQDQFRLSHFDLNLREKSVIVVPIA